MWHLRGAVLGIAIVVLAGSSAVHCGAAEMVVFDNMPNNSHQNYGTWMGSGFNQVMYAASSFTPSATGQITRFDAAMWYRDPSPNQVTLHVLPAVGAVPPTENSIWSQTYSGALARYGGISSFQVDDGPTVNAGTQYWLYVETPVTGLYNPGYDWYDGTIGGNSTAWYFAQSPTRSDSWEVFAPSSVRGRSLRVTAVVPEPSSVGLLTVAGAVGLTRRCRRVSIVGLEEEEGRCTL
jgi:hypothetical protein